MRELARSMMSYTWAMSIFGVQQAINLVTPGSGGDQWAKTGQAFDKVTEATTKTFDASIMQAFKAGNSLQAGMVDMIFSGLMAGGCDPSRLMRRGSDAMQNMSGMGQPAPGAGSNPATPSGSVPSSSNWGSMPR